MYLLDITVIFKLIKTNTQCLPFFVFYMYTIIFNQWKCQEMHHLNKSKEGGGLAYLRIVIDNEWIILRELLWSSGYSGSVMVQKVAVRW